MKTKTVYTHGEKVLLKDLQGNTISEGVVVCQETDCGFDITEQLSPEKIKEIKRISRVKKEPLPFKNDWISTLKLGPVFYPALKLGIGFTDNEVEHHLFLVQTSSVIGGYKVTGQEAAYALKSCNQFEKSWLGFQAQ